MKHIVAIEVGTEWLKWLKIAAVDITLKGPRLVYVSAKHIAASSDEILSSEIAKILKEARLKPNPLIVSFCRHLATVRNLKFPSTDAKELSDMINLHIGRQVPYSKEDVISGYQLIGTDEMGYTKVMVAIVHRDLVNKILRILEGAGLSTERIEISSDGVYSWEAIATRFAQSLKPQEGALLLDIDYNFIDIQVASSKTVLFSRTITFGASKMIEDMSSSCTKLIGEVRHSLILYQDEEPKTRVARILISGASVPEGIKDILSKEFNLPVDVISAFKNIPLSKSCIPLLKTIPNEISISGILGLSLDSQRTKISLLPPEIKIRRSLKERTKDMIIIGAISIYIIIILGGIFLEKMLNKQEALKVLDMRLAQIGKESANLENMLEAIKLTKKRLDIKDSALSTLYQLQRLVPSEIILESVSIIGAGSVSLKGTAGAMSDVFKFITMLEESKYFKNIETKYTTKKKGEGEKTTFELICPIHIE